VTAHDPAAITVGTAVIALVIALAAFVWWMSRK